MTAPRRLRAVLNGVLAAVIAIGVTACGIGAQDSAQPINPDALGGLDQTVPPDSGVAGPTTMAPSTVVAPVSTLGTGTTPATLYFIEGPSLVPVTVEVPPGLELRAFLRRLEAGPPQPAIDAGIRSAIPPDLIASVRLSAPRDSVTIDFDPAVLQTVDGRDRPLLIGQVVLTVTEYGPKRVRFTLAGEPLQVPRRDGTLTDGTDWVTAFDYEPLTTPVSDVPESTTR